MSQLPLAPHGHCCRCLGRLTLGINWRNLEKEK